MSRSCVVFDLDDTLYLERDYVHSGYQAIDRWLAAEAGLPHFASTAWQLFESGVRSGIFESVLASQGFVPDARFLASMLDVYRTHVPDITLPLDAVQCLQSSSIRNTATALITDGDPSRQFSKCQSLGIEHYFGLSLCTGIWGTAFFKPNARAFQTVQHQFPHCDFLYVADNPVKDFQAPLALGWKAIRIRRSASLHFAKPNLPGFEPHFELPDLSMLPDLIEQHIS